jgi:hypothetical protein
LLAFGPGRFRGMMQMKGERFNILPSRARPSCVVVDFKHSPNRQYAKPGFRVLRFRFGEVSIKTQDRLSDVGRFVRGNLTHLGIEGL